MVLLNYPEAFENKGKIKNSKIVIPSKIVKTKSIAAEKNLFSFLMGLI